MPHQRLHGMSCVADDDWHRVAEPPFEFARRSSGLGTRPPFGWITNKDFAVLTNEDDRRDLGSVGAQWQWFGSSSTCDGGS